MLTLNDIRQYIADLEITANDNVYIGKMYHKKQKSIGIYSRQTNGSPVTALGGLECTTYEARPVSLLVHWTKSVTETEAVAYDLFEKLKNTTIQSIGGIPIQFIRLMVPEPQDVGTDDDGVYEYVIWLDFICGKE